MPRTLEEYEKLRFGRFRKFRRPITAVSLGTLLLFSQGCAGILLDTALFAIMGPKAFTQKYGDDVPQRPEDRQKQIQNYTQGDKLSPQEYYNQEYGQKKFELR